MPNKINKRQRRERIDRLKIHLAKLLKERKKLHSLIQAIRDDLREVYYGIQNTKSLIKFHEKALENSKNASKKKTAK